MTNIINKDLIKKLSKLAKIDLTEKEIEKYAKDFTSVVGYMDEIKKLDVENIPETARVINEDNVLRDDVVGPSFNQKQALRNSKITHGGYFLVPQILKDD